MIAMSYYSMYMQLISTQANTTAPFEASSDHLFSIEATDAPPMLPSPIDVALPSESTSQPIRLAPNCPTYRPTFGCYRNEHDLLPEAPLVPLDDVEAPPAPQTSVPPRVRRIHLRVNPEPVPYKTLPDSFGQFRVYPSKPNSIPDLGRELADVCDIRVASCPHESTASRTVPEIVAPCPNASAFRLQYWHWNQGDKKSKGARESLVRDVITAPDFVPADLRSLDWHRMDRSLASDTVDTSTGWKTDTLPLNIPPRNRAKVAEFKSNPECGTLLVPDFRHRSLISAVKDACSNNDIKSFHYQPYTSKCVDPLTSMSHTTYGEVYESQRMRDAHEAIQKIKLDEHCSLPRCAAMIMAFSDATQLAAFGHATAWPIRIALGNLSKYERCKPNSRNHYEVGFVPSVSID
jgi:hypothetical protein